VRSSPLLELHPSQNTETYLFIKEESSFLSSQQSTASVHAILEQLYEDLNSYSETSIPIDRFNSIELKIFPFYPNPPTVTDWMVPLALINLTKRIEDNWDLTMVKVRMVIYSSSSEFPNVPIGLQIH